MPSTSHLLSLPAEIRMMIWKHLLLSPRHAITERPNAEEAGQSLWTCRSMFEEGLSLLYGGNVFGISFISEICDIAGMDSASILTRAQLDIHQKLNDPGLPRRLPEFQSRRVKEILIGQRLEDVFQDTAQLGISILQSLDLRRLARSARRDNIARADALRCIGLTSFECSDLIFEYWMAQVNWFGQGHSSQLREIAKRKLYKLATRIAVSAVTWRTITVRATPNNHGSKMQYLLVCDEANSDDESPSPWLVLLMERQTTHG